MMQSQHSSQVREAIITLRAKGFSYEKIAKSINNGLGPISKGTVCYNVKKYKETNSVENQPKTGRPCNKRTPQMIKNTREKIRRLVKRSMRKMASMLSRFESDGLCNLGNLGPKGLFKTP